ncbi:MAG TPA: hypothetical protein VKU02_13790, partial [Gemmataceae bacterium]|nr:hypothetical protein [Gemmataceae bacterium]
MPIEGTQPAGGGALPLLEAAAVRAVGAGRNLQIGEIIRATVLGTTADRAILDLNGSPFSVDRTPGLETGAEVSVRVTGLTPQPTLEVESLTPGSDQKASFLQVGQEVEGKLLQQLAPDRFLVAIGGNQVEAVVLEGVADGQPVQLRVAEVQPQLLLHIAGSGPAIEADVVSLIRAHLGDLSPGGAPLADLQAALGRLAAGSSPQASLPSVARLQAFLQTVLNPQTTLDADGLAHLVRDGGLHYEAKLAQLVVSAAPTPGQIAARDLKGLLLQVQHDLTAETPSSRPVALPSETSPRAPLPSSAALTQPATSSTDFITNFLGHLETQQALNLLAQLHATPFQLQIPLFTGGAFSTVHLGIEPDADSNPKGEGGASRGGYNLYFQLELEPFGQTRIDARIIPQSIRVNFFFEQAQAVARVRSELPALSETLRSLGFDEVLL